MSEERAQYEYGDEDVYQLTMVNTILLEFLCSRYIRNSFDPDKELKDITNALALRTMELKGKKTSKGFHLLAVRTAKHIVQLVNELDKQQWVSWKETEHFDPPKEPPKH